MPRLCFTGADKRTLCECPPQIDPVTASVAGASLIHLMILGDADGFDVTGADEFARALRRKISGVDGQPHGSQAVSPREREQQPATPRRIPMATVWSVNFISNLAGTTQRPRRTDAQANEAQATLRAGSPHFKFAPRKILRDRIGWMPCRQHELQFAIDQLARPLKSKGFHDLPLRCRGWN